MFSPGPICWFVGLIASTITQNYLIITTKPGVRMRFGSGKKPLNVGAAPDQGEDPFIHFLFHCEIQNVSTFSSISLVIRGKIGHI